MTVLEQLPKGSRVAIIRLRSLGDCVLTTPALACSKRSRPDLDIAVVGRRALPASIREQSLYQPDPSAQLARSAQIQPELCINLHGGPRSQWMTALSGARWRAGFAHHSTTLAYNLKIPRAQRILGVNRTVHTAEHLASSLFALGRPAAGCSTSVLAREIARPGHATRCCIHLHPPRKSVDAKRFCEVARYLKLWNIHPVFLAAPQDDITPSRATASFGLAARCQGCTVQGRPFYRQRQRPGAHSRRLWSTERGVVQHQQSCHLGAMAYGIGSYHRVRRHGRGERFARHSRARAFADA